MISTGNIQNLAESIRLYNAAANDDTSNNIPGMSDSQKQAFQSNNP